MLYESLTSNILDKYLFQNIRHLILSKNLLGIESGLLNEFKPLISIDLESLNLREFLHSGNEWLENFNNGVNAFGKTKNKYKNQILRFFYIY